MSGTTEATATTQERIDRTFNELLVAESALTRRNILSAIWDDDLQAVHDAAFEHYAYELAFGAVERSAWVCGNIIVNANQGPIRSAQTVLEAVRTEMDWRKVVDQPATTVLN